MAGGTSISRAASATTRLARMLDAGTHVWVRDMALLQMLAPRWPSRWSPSRRSIEEGVIVTGASVALVDREGQLWLVRREVHPGRGDHDMAVAVWTTERAARATSPQGSRDLAALDAAIGAERARWSQA